ncbi:MAG: helix-hairpin-helix domain-containing protein [Saprospiraceae bacterium]|nr:helix-hairpin-helix domain-containing protein [Saprospiraceae bacterium]
MNKSALEKYYLTKTELHGLQVLVIISLLYTGWIAHLGNQFSSAQISQKQAESVLMDTISKNNYNHFINAKLTPAEHSLFEFDPNNLSEQEAIQLGIPIKAFRNLQKYKAKGGRIKSETQFKNIYGMDTAVYSILKPYIKITQEKDPLLPIRKAQSQDSIYDINTIEIRQLLYKLNIDYKIAYRILNFRNALGGFYSLDQLHEIYGIEDSTITRIQKKLAVRSMHQKFNMDQIPLDSLGKHPYIKYKTARLIGKYREQHGTIHSIQELQLIIPDTQQFRKITRYFYGLKDLN